VADAVARSFSERPLLCELIAHTPLNLERNVSTAAVRRYKLTSLGAVKEAAGLVQGVLPALAELYVTDPDLVHARVELTARLRRTAQILLARLIPSRDGHALLRPGAGFPAGEELLG
jgi:hypothetical protein